MKVLQVNLPANSALILNCEVCEAIQQSFSNESDDGCSQYLMDLIEAQIGENMLTNYAKIVYKTRSEDGSRCRFVEVDNHEQEIRGHETDVAVFVAFY